MATIAVINTKGGASKSTFALQVAGAYFLSKGKEVNLFEFDDENKDSKTFTNSAVRASQIKIGDGKDISDILRNSLLSHQGENLVIDVGGNKTTTIFIDGLKKSFLYKKIDLFIIPMSGGSQDLDNAVKTYKMIESLGIPVLFGLSRVRSLERFTFQYRDFFIHFPNDTFAILTDSDSIDLSRLLKKTVYEIAVDKEMIYILEEDMISAFDSNDNERAKNLSFQYEIYGEAGKYLEEILQPAWVKLDKLIGDDNAN